MHRLILVEVFLTKWKTEKFSHVYLYEVNTHINHESGENMCVSWTEDVIVFEQEIFVYMKEEQKRKLKE